MTKTILFFAFAFLNLAVQAQIISFPDSNFKAALLVYGPTIDLNGDKEIQVSEAQEVKLLNVVGHPITDLTGIESFTSLTSLYCYSLALKSLDVTKNTALTLLNCNNNQLASLDVSKNTSLTYLNCSYNQLTDLDVSKNTTLNYLYFNNNQLTSIDVSKNTALIHLGTGNNYFTSFDVSKNTALTLLDCYNNQLTSLDVRNNTALSDLYCSKNPNLTKICINPTQQGKVGNWSKDATAVWSTNCSLTTGLESDTFSNNETKTLVRILTSLGQEVYPGQVLHGLYIYQYSDGSTKKVFKREGN